MAFYEKDIPIGSAFDDCDDFWDISKIMPKKKPVTSRFSTKEKTADIILPAKEKNGYTASDKKLNFEIYKADEIYENSNERSYIPGFAKLIAKVTIKPSIDRFDFYDTFRKAALIYFDYRCSKCDFVPFYSYMPQYVQMTTEQKKYYFYWRDEFRHNRYLKIDYSYIYLYAYEILNLPDKIGKEEGLKLLCDVWLAYRKDLPRLDANFSTWIQDYCLVYGLECPYERIKDFLFDIISASSFKEFYLSDISSGTNASSAMIAYLSDYDWRRGKYAGGDNSEMYKKHVECAMKCIFERVLSNERIIKSELSKISRTAFPGSLCTHTVKCRLEIEYYSISHSSELRLAVTAALKYTENKLRACLGVKSRLAVKDLPDDFKAVIDKYFDFEFKRLERESARANAPEYERLYDATEEKVSFENAIEIEKTSWRMTARLTDEYVEDNVFDGEPKCEDTFGICDEKADKNRYGLRNEYISFISAALNGDIDMQKRISSDCAIPLNTIAEKVNEAFSDNFGDVVLEESDYGGFKVIDDYYEEISDWIL